MTFWKRALYIAALLATPVHAKMYKYTDQSGNVHYVDSPSRIPSEYREQMLKQELKETQTGQAAGADPQRKTLTSSLDQRKQFWKRRKSMLESKIRHLEKDCIYWSAPLSELNSRRDTLNPLGKVICNELIRTTADLENLSKELRQSGGMVTWLY